MDTVRNRRVRKLVKNLNRHRKTQARKIDLLCNDFVSLNRRFLEQLKNQELLVAYYENILGCPDLETLLDTTAEFIQDSITPANVAIYVQCAFRSHICDTQEIQDFDCQDFEKSFTSDVVEHICSNCNCLDLDAMLKSGLVASPRQLKNLTAVAIPFAQSGINHGFVLVYRDAGSPLTASISKVICSVIPALTRRIDSLVPVIEGT